MHRHAIWVGVLLGACATGDVDRARPTQDIAAVQQASTSAQGISVERTDLSKPKPPEGGTGMRTPSAPRRASEREVAKMEQEVEAQRKKARHHRSAKELDRLLAEIVETSPGRDRQWLLEQYIVDAFQLDEAGRKRAIARANAVLEPTEVK